MVIGICTLVELLTLDPFNVSVSLAAVTVLWQEQQDKNWSDDVGYLLMINI